MDDTKPIHTLILDAGPIIQNSPPVSTLLAKSHTLLTIPAILSEIRDAPTRSRLETTLKPFLTVRNPTPESVKAVQDFARRSGDLPVLSRPDLLILALAYEVECERNGGDWRLRKVPGQKGLNGVPPKKTEGGEVQKTVGADDLKEDDNALETNSTVAHVGECTAWAPETTRGIETDGTAPTQDTDGADTIRERLADTHISPEPTDLSEAQNDASPAEIPLLESNDDIGPSPSPDSDSDSEGWITPSNIARHQLADATPASSTLSTSQPKTLQVATLTSDFAMQNVLLLMNLNLLSPSLSRIQHLRTYILRCHACFLQIKDLSKQFCPRCGQPSLTRVSCSTDMRTGQFKLHLKNNMQWNTRGDRYSIPKPVPGSSSGKRENGGGKGGWGKELILTEDQKEYVRAVAGGRRTKERDLMDDDFLPGILSGERARHGGRPKVGAGRNVNSRRR